MSYTTFFQQATRNPPSFYQTRIAEHNRPGFRDMLTGSDKTAAVVVTWPWKLLESDPEPAHRLIYTLPVRSLVEKTAESAQIWCAAARNTFADRSLPDPRVHALGIFASESAYGAISE